MPTPARAPFADIGVMRARGSTGGRRYRVRIVWPASMVMAEPSLSRGGDFDMGDRSSGPCPHSLQQVMSTPVSRSIISGPLSASGGAGSGWANSCRHRASLAAWQRLAMSP